MNLNSVCGNGFLEQMQEVLACGIVWEKFSFFRAETGHMVKFSGNLGSQRTGHMFHFYIVPTL
jgi:hypothetical protein